MNSLFDMDEAKKDSPKLQVTNKYVEKYDIHTHFSDHADPQWMAIPMNIAREIGKGWLKDETDGSSIEHITASIGILLDDRGLTFYAQSKEEVIAMAIDFLKEREDNAERLAEAKEEGGAE